LAAALLLTLLAGLGTSLEMWRRSEAAHRESEEHVAVLRQLMTNNVHARASWFRLNYEANHLPEALLMDAELCLSHLLQSRADDQELRVLLADVLTCRALRREAGDGLVLLERAARLWEQIPLANTWEPGLLVSRASTYRHLGLVCAQQGRLDQALPA